MKLHQILDKAIRGKYQISFTYDDLFRVVEPHHYGILHGTEQLHAYQITGDSTSGGIPEWRNFSLDKMTNLKMNEAHFKTRKSYNPSNSHYQNIIIRVDR